MPKFDVDFVMECRGQITVEADTEEEAALLVVEETEYSTLLELSGMPDIEADLVQPALEEDGVQ